MQDGIWKTSIGKKEFFVSNFLVLLCLLKSVAYYNDAERFHNIMIAPFAKQKWTELGESFVSTTSPAPIVDRIKAVKSQLRPDDTVLFLSPFDHLMAAYLNPEHYCGHFELVTNLVTDELTDKAIDCLRASSHALLIYDDASETAPPPFSQERYYDLASYGAKEQLERHNEIVLKTLANEFVLVKKIGDLSFYRRAGYKDISTQPL